MISKELNDWLQVVGLFGVLGGLIFVGLQLSLDRQVALVEGTQAGTAMQQYWAELVNENAEVWVKGLAGEPLSAIEAARFDALISARQLSYFNGYSRANRGVSGQLPERFVIDLAIEIHANPGFLMWWTEYRKGSDERRQRLGLQSSPFQLAIDEELRRLESDDSTH